MPNYRFLPGLGGIEGAPRNRAKRFIARIRSRIWVASARKLQVQQGQK